MDKERIQQQIFINLVESVVQSRVDVRRVQMNKFNEFITQIQTHKKSAFQTNVPTFLQALLIEPKTEVARLIKPGALIKKAVVTFTLCSTKHSEEYYGQTWVLQMSKCKGGNQGEYQFLPLASTFMELLYLLNSLPLFTDFHRDQSLKQQFKIKYKLNVSNSKTSDGPREDMDIRILPKHYSIQRRCGCLTIRIKCYTLRELGKLRNRSKEKKDRLDFQQEDFKNKLTKFPSSKMVKHKSLDETNTTEDLYEPFIDLDIPKKRRISVYEVYDQKLDCTFLSNDENSFRESPKQLIKQIQFVAEALMEMEDDFEVLEVSKDEQLLQKIEPLCRELARMEQFMGFETFQHDSI